MAVKKQVNFLLKFSTKTKLIATLKLYTKPFIFYEYNAKRNLELTTKPL